MPEPLPQIRRRGSKEKEAFLAKQKAESWQAFKQVEARHAEEFQLQRKNKRLGIIALLKEKGATPDELQAVSEAFTRISRIRRRYNAVEGGSEVGVQYCKQLFGLLRAEINFIQERLEMYDIENKKAIQLIRGI